MTNSLAVQHIVYHETAPFPHKVIFLPSLPQIKLVVAKDALKKVVEAYKTCIQLYCHHPDRPDQYMSSTICVYPGTVVQKTTDDAWIMFANHEEKTIFLPGLLHQDANKKTCVEVLAPANCLYELMSLEWHAKFGNGAAIYDIIQAAKKIYSNQLAREMDLYLNYLDIT